MTGLLLVALGIVRLGWITALVSKPIRIGYLHGIALVVIVGQIPKLLGFSVDGDALVDDLKEVVRGVSDGATDRPTALLGMLTLATIVGLQAAAPRIPGMLVGLVAATTAVWTLDLDVATIGALPRGLPQPALDGLQWSDFASLAPATARIALVALSDTAALTRALDRGGGDDNREMVALGTANVAAGLLGGFAVSGSASRTPVARDSGARTQVALLVGAVVVTFLLLAPLEAARYVPSAALAAVVIAAVLKLIDPGSITALWRMSRTEFTLGFAAFLGVALVGVLEGIGIAAGLSLAAFVAKAWRPHTAELVRVEGRKGYHDATRHPTGVRVPGLVIVRFDAPLFFANGAAFAEMVRRTIAESGEARWVAVAAEPITDIDTTAAEALVDLDDELQALGTRLVFAEAQGACQGPPGPLRAECPVRTPLLPDRRICRERLPRTDGYGLHGLDRPRAVSQPGCQRPPGQTGKQPDGLVHRAIRSTTAPVTRSWPRSRRARSASSNG